MDVARPQHLYAVDPWYLAEAEWTWARGHRSTVLGLAGALRRSRTAVAAGGVEIRIAFDTDFLRGLDDHHLDWAYIDTTHEYDQTREELELLERKVRARGIVAGDDWQTEPGHRHYGVKRAIDEFVAAGRAQLVRVDEPIHQWAIELPA